MQENSRQLDWDGLMALVSDEASSPDTKGWAVCRYLNDNMGEGMPSEVARKLLLLAMRLPLARPSALYSRLLAVALRLAEAYPDFRLDGFMRMWDVANLRACDYEQRQGRDGRSYPSLAGQLARAVVRRSLTRPDEAYDERLLAEMRHLASQAGFMPVLPMVAVKVFEKQDGRRKIRMVKLVGPAGEELAADWHAFGLKPWEIAGRMYDVLPRVSAASGQQRVDTVAPSVHRIDEVFPRQIGYVDRYDPAHRHCHVYAPDSGHYVAETATPPPVGTFVWFAPVVPREDRFKTAVLLGGETTERGMEAFGVTAAVVEYVDADKGFFAYRDVSGAKGFGRLERTAVALASGVPVRLLIYLKRGSDGQKHPYVAMAWPG